MALHIVTQIFTSLTAAREALGIFFPLAHRLNRNSCNMDHRKAKEDRTTRDRLFGFRLCVPVKLVIIGESAALAESLESCNIPFFDNLTEPFIKLASFDVQLFPMNSHNIVTLTVLQFVSIE